MHAVRERGVDGVICGHIHSAAIKQIDGMTYINCGDWVDSCTAIVEHLDGRMELLTDWIPATAANDEDKLALAPTAAASNAIIMK
jgi:hypothetical protein